MWENECFNKVYGGWSFSLNLVYTFNLKKKFLFIWFKCTKKVNGKKEKTWEWRNFIRKWNEKKKDLNLGGFFNESMGLRYLWTAIFSRK